MDPTRGTNRSTADRTAPPRETAADFDHRHDLVCAIGHEIGNHLGAIRLQAHLLDDDLDTRALARASVEIDALAGRAGPLLALLRPILAEDLPPAGSNSTWAITLHRVARQLDDDGTRGVRFDVQVSPADGETPAPGYDWLHALLMALVEATIADLPNRGMTLLRLERGDDESALILEDDGPDGDLAESSSLRGRSLALAIARWLVGRAGGRVEANRIEARTRVEIIFPDRL
jgi:hypothetical protein